MSQKVSKYRKLHYLLGPSLIPGPRVTHPLLPAVLCPNSTLSSLKLPPHPHLFNGGAGSSARGSFWKILTFYRGATSSNIKFSFFGQKLFPQSLVAWKQEETRRKKTFIWLQLAFYNFCWFYDVIVISISFSVQHSHVLHMKLEIEFLCCLHF